MDALENQYDVIVVGSGGGGLCAALVARQFGKRVCILEKLDQVGGSTAYSGGVLWIPNSPPMRRAGVRDSYERAREYLDSVVPDEGSATGDARRRMFLQSAPRTVEFLERIGMKFVYADGWSDYYDERPGGESRGRSIVADIFDLKVLGGWRHRLATYPPFRNIPVAGHHGPALSLFMRTWAGKKALLKLVWTLAISRLSGKELAAHGAALQGRMLQLVLNYGIPVFHGVAVRDLIVENSRVVGVRAAYQGNEVTIRAESVLLNAGGFARNDALRKRWQQTPIADTSASPGDTGEILEKAIEIGAATANLDASIWVLTSRSATGAWPTGSVDANGRIFPPMHIFDIAKPYSIVVDASGARYVNEAASYVELGEAMYKGARMGQGTIPSWMIMDARFLKYYGLGASVPGQKPREWIKSGYLRQASTLRQLAIDCQISPEGLEATVTRFNQHAARGADPDFQRGARQYDRWRGDPTVGPNPCLGPIEKAPFFAVALFPGDVGTSGGIMTDEYSRVMREDRSTISGLYAFGNVAVSLFGYTYPGAGASIAQSFVFGFVAAHHAVGAAAELATLIASDIASSGDCR